MGTPPRGGVLRFWGLPSCVLPGVLLSARVSFEERKTPSRPSPVSTPNPRDGRIAVIVPCFNEAGRIGDVVRSVRRVLPEAEVTVVNDDSTDGAAVEARSAGAVVLTHGCNLGYGAALETGYLHALGANYRYVLQMDGDGQHLAEELEKLLLPLVREEADIVIGSRYGSGATEAAPLVRRWGHQVFAALLAALTGLRLTDPTSGFQGLNRRALRLYASGVLPYDYPDSDVILMSRLSGLRIREVPVRMRARAGGTSMHSGLKPLYYCAKMLLSMSIVLLNVRAWRHWRRANAQGVELPAG
jgi:glycosyltransferase involved in cell wall biosynthesis